MSNRSKQITLSLVLQSSRPVSLHNSHPRTLLWSRAQANGTSLDLAYEGVLSPDLSNLAQIVAEAMALDPPIDIIVGK